MLPKKQKNVRVSERRLYVVSIALVLQGQLLMQLRVIEPPVYLRRLERSPSFPRKIAKESQKYCYSEKLVRIKAYKRIRFGKIERVRSHIRRY